MDTVNLKWNRYILSYDFERQVDILRSLSQNSMKISFQLGRFAAFPDQFKSWMSSLQGGIKDNEEPATTFFTKEGVIGLGVTILGLLTFGFFVWRRSHRHRDRVWFYKPLVRRLEKKAGPKPAAQTLLEFISQSQAKIDSSYEDALVLQSLYYRLRFNPNDILSVDEANLVREKLQKM